MYISSGCSRREASSHQQIGSLQDITDVQTKPGIYKPTAGNIQFEGETISGLTSDLITKKGINRTFQNVRLFGNLSVLENVLVGMQNKINYPLLSAAFRTKKVRESEKQVREKGMELLKLMGLEDKWNMRAANMSYGNQRRLELARALANEPKLLLLDEPTAGMNPQEAVQMIELVQSIQTLGMAILIIEHNMKVVMGLSERIVCIEAGTKIAEGSPEDIQHNPGMLPPHILTQYTDFSHLLPQSHPVLFS